MNEAERMFKQEVREKKRLGYGARHKKNGSKSKKCTLPSDHLTRKEKEKLNGEVNTYNMKVFYSVEEFKTMPYDIQVEYINSIMTRYNVGLSTISQIVFGKNQNYLYNHFTRTGDIQYLNTSKGRGSRVGRSHLEEDALRARSTASIPSTIAEETPQPEEVITKPEPVITPSASKASISEFLIRMDKFDDNLWNRVKDLFSDSENLSITISVCKEP